MLQPVLGLGLKGRNTSKTLVDGDLQPLPIQQTGKSVRGCIEVKMCTGFFSLENLGA